MNYITPLIKFRIIQYFLYMSSNLRKIQEIKKLTNDIKSIHKYLYGNNDRRSAPFFLDQDQDWATINQIFEQYVGDLEKKIERRDKLNDLRPKA